MWVTYVLQHACSIRLHFTLRVMLYRSYFHTACRRLQFVASVTVAIPVVRRSAP